ncbi:MAG: hypothetical protein KY475_10790 [Planctomycetes bacterium]|nr:hypothetical protein [Planctomycetota bacterium]
MKLLAVPLLVLGGLIQVGGVLYAILGFEELNWRVLIFALVVGTLVEMTGVAMRVIAR